MRAADTYCANQFDDFTLYHNRKIHRRRLREGVRSDANFTAPPQRFNHFGENDSKKRFMKQEQWKKIDFENQILLKKMSKICEGGSQSVGGPPPLSKKKGSRPAGAGGNAFLRRRQQEKIHSENKAMLRRITNADPQYSTNRLAIEERKRLKYLSNLGRYRKQRGKFVGDLQDAVNRGSLTERNRYSHGYDGVDPTRMALAKVNKDEMGLLIGNKRPPGSTRKVFTALMLLVSPFETSELDVQWTAVQEWVDSLGGVAEWLHNLWNFNIGLVPVGNAAKCKKYIIDRGLEDKNLRLYSPCLANFLLWILEVCACAQPMTARESVSGSGRRTAGDGGPRFAEPDEFSRPQALPTLDCEDDSEEEEIESTLQPQPPPQQRQEAEGRPSNRVKPADAESEKVAPSEAVDQSAEDTAAQEKAATKIQAVARGKEGRKKARTKKQAKQLKDGGDDDDYDDEFEDEEEDEYEDEFDEDDDEDGK